MENPSLRAALSHYDAVRERYVKTLEERGLRFAPAHEQDAEIDALRTQLREQEAVFRNNGASIQVGWLSKACVECTGSNGSETFSTTFKCHRDCYFCFNYNLADYERFVREGCPWEEGLEAAVKKTGGKMAVVGLTGGEPLLNIDDTIAFLERARELFPDAHKRMYTSGDLLTEDMAARLRDAGLREIRFSIKQDDKDDVRERVLRNMKMAGDYISDVVVEMPIVPGTEDVMHEWMRRFEDNGIRGMNLLEFCFPFHSWPEFEKRGFLLRNPPFEVMYDYSYSGGLAVAGSEELSLRLMLWALGENLSFGMHYCSLENKHRSEMRQMNERGRGIHPCYSFDTGDFFLKSAKVYGGDIQPARDVLATLGCESFLENKREDSLVFPLRFADLIADSGFEVVTSFNVLETDERGSYLREVGIEKC